MLFESDQTIPFLQWVVRPSQKTFLSLFTKSMSSSCFYYEMILNSIIYLTVVFVSNLKSTWKYNDQWEIPEYFPSRPRSPSRDPSN